MSTQGCIDWFRVKMFCPKMMSLEVDVVVVRDTRWISFSLVNDFNLACKNVGGQLLAGTFVSF